MALYTLRISGLGHSVTLQHVDPATTTVEDLKATIQSRTGLPPCYQRLLARGSKLDQGNPNDITLEEAGVKDRTKIMLLHSALYAADKSGFEALRAIEKEIDALSTRVQQQHMESKLVSELVTRICCKLDEVDTAGSEHLRAQRKELLQKAETIEQSFSSAAAAAATAAAVGQGGP